MEHLSHKNFFLNYGLGIFWLLSIVRFLTFLCGSFRPVGILMVGVCLVRFVIVPRFIKPPKTLPLPALLTGSEQNRTSNESIAKAGKERLCLVTGATGFAGKVLVKMLLEVIQHQSDQSSSPGSSEWSKKGLILYSRIRAAGGRSAPQFNNALVEGVTIDLTSFPSCLQATQGCETVYHVASAVEMRSNKFRDPIVINSNVIGAYNLINACIQNGVKRLIYSGSMSAQIPLVAALPQQLGHFQARPYSAAGPIYGQTKAHSHMVVCAGHGRGGLRTVRSLLIVLVEYSLCQPK
jgi:hypothetical protein